MGRGGGVYTPARTRDYESLVHWSCIEHRTRHPAHRFGPDEPVEVWIELFFKGGSIGDVDNYAKSILDGMQTSLVISNDRQIVRLHVSKTVSKTEPERAVITIRPLPAESAAGRTSAPTPSTESS